MGRHDVALPHKTLVAYVVEGREELRNVKEVEGVYETDEAELKAIAFAIAELKERLDNFTILCDNESVVSEIKRGVARPRSRPALSEIQAEIKSRLGNIKIELLNNPADKLLNEYVVAAKKKQESATEQK
jgi:ribonuclease HI